MPQVLNCFSLTPPPFYNIGDVFIRSGTHERRSWFRQAILLAAVLVLLWGTGDVFSGQIYRGRLAEGSQTPIVYFWRISLAAVFNKNMGARYLSVRGN